MIRAMLDIETLSSDNHAVVTAIGLALFDREKIVDGKAWYLDYESDKGHIDPRTVRWWMQQNAAVRDVNLGGKENPFKAAQEIITYLPKGAQVWANAPQFDCVIMRNWFKRLALPCAWHFRDERDCRTMFEIGRTLGAKVPPKSDSHDALADAVWQAQYVLATESKIYAPPFVLA